MVGAAVIFFTRTSFCCLLILAASQFAAADPPAAKENDKDKAPPAERIVQTGRLVGTINGWNETDGKFTLHIKFAYSEANVQAQQNYLRDLQNLTVRQQTIMQNRNLLQRQRDLAKWAQDYQNFFSKPQNFYQVKEKEQDVDVELIDEAKIRLASPPAKFDDKGNIKAYTAEELKELKGTGEDAKLPGFAGERDGLRNGQMVLVTLGYKPAAKDGEAAKKKPEDVEKKPEDGDKKKKMPPVAPRAKVVQVMVLAEPKN